MGRMLEALNHVEATIAPALTPAPLPLPHAPESIASVEEETAEEVPYIEVGGPRKIIVASPAVLACAPPAPRIAAAIAPAKVEPAPKTILFRPIAPGRLLSPARQRFAPELIAFHQPEHPLSEGYRGLLSEMQAQVVLFTAPEGEAGSSTVLLNVAIIAARLADARVVAVDACGHRPSLARLLGLPAAPGLADVLMGAVALPPALQETGLDRLVALTVGKPGEDGSVRLVLEAMPVVLRQLREQFSLVLLDGPPALAAACDAVFVVASQEQAEAPPVLDLLQTIRQQGGPLRGCILTDG